MNASRNNAAAAARRKTIRVGTCGWHYAHWRGRFYPATLPAREWLAWYAQRFRAVEIDSTFYRVPEAAVFALWRASVPHEFRFAVKAPRAITHRRKLRDCEEPLQAFMERAAVLGPTLGPILFQLPPRWRRNAARLAAFLELLPASARYVFEFRDPSWHHREIYALLRKARVAFCIYHLAGFRSPDVATTDYVYLRLHGPRGAYGGSYRLPALRALADAVHGWQGRGKGVYVFFDNDEAAYAARDAARLARLLERPE